MTRVEVYFKDNTKESFFADKFAVKSGKLIVEYGKKETIISQSDVKYYTSEKNT